MMRAGMMITGMMIPISGWTRKMQLLVQEIAKTLPGQTRKMRQLYRANMAAVMNKLDSLTAEIEAELRPVKTRICGLS